MPLCLFAFVSAVDKLIHYVNKDGRVNAFYSTPAIMTQALHDANINLTLKVNPLVYLLSLLILPLSVFLVVPPALLR